jgi:hypothetical protein
MNTCESVQDRARASQLSNWNGRKGGHDKDLRASLESAAAKQCGEQVRNSEQAGRQEQQKMQLLRKKACMRQ